MKKTTLSWFMMVLLSLIIQPFLSARTLAEETYKFERMWPTMRQPWFFNSPLGIAVDANGNVYVVDSGNNRIQKFSPDGVLVSKWREVWGDTLEWPSGITFDDDGNVYIVPERKPPFRKGGQGGLDKWRSI